MDLSTSRQSSSRGERAFFSLARSITTECVEVSPLQWSRFPFDHLVRPLADFSLIPPDCFLPAPEGYFLELVGNADLQLTSPSFVKTSAMRRNDVATTISSPPFPALHPISSTTKEFSRHFFPINRPSSLHPFIHCSFLRLRCVFFPPYPGLWWFEGLEETLLCSPPFSHLLLELLDGRNPFQFIPSTYRQSWRGSFCSFPAMRASRGALAAFIFP